MRAWLLIVLVTLTASLSAQSGRHFRRPSRLPVTPAASAVVEASAQRAARPEPQRRLRSGRAWSAHHFTRRPAAVPARTAVPVDASTRSPLRRTPMWGRPVRNATAG
ncbi:MAG: hypothetical protein JNL08_16145 [Planctomycetes bacterium]|nr:hypothetical protein [Planctomycetota bacterium]